MSGDRPDDRAPTRREDVAATHDAVRERRSMTDAPTSPSTAAPDPTPAPSPTPAPDPTPAACPTSGDGASPAWPGVAARAEDRTLRFGHMGCHAVVPGNTIASIEYAATLGVDVVEFDVLPDGRGGLRLAHDPVDLAARPDAPTMEEALDRLCEPDLAHLGINLDAKVPGDEAAIAAALCHRGLVGRTLVSSTETPTLRALRAVDPGVRIGRSVPRASRDWTAVRWARIPLAAAVVGLRATLPRLLVRELRAGRIDAVMAHWSLITPAFARTVTAHGELYVWTVDDADRADAIRACGVTGVTSNDPRLLRW